MGRVGAVLVELRWGQVRLLILRREVLELQQLRQKVRSVDLKFLLIDVLVRSLTVLVMERDNR